MFVLSKCPTELFLEFSSHVLSVNSVFQSDLAIVFRWMWLRLLLRTTDCLSLTLFLHSASANTFVKAQLLF